MGIRRTAATLAGVAALGVGGVVLASPAAAGPIFTGGLVNIVVEDNIVQVPIGVAVNVCGVSVAVLAESVPFGPFQCNAATTADLPVVFR